MQQFNIIFAPALHKFDPSLESRYIIITVFSLYTVGGLGGWLVGWLVWIWLDIVSRPGHEHNFSCS